MTESALDPRIPPLLLAIAGTCDPRVARDIRRPPLADRGLRAAVRARPRAPRRDRHGVAHAPASDRARHDTPDRTHTASRSPRPPPRTSYGTRYIDGACAGECAVGKCSSRVGHDPAAAPDLITRRGGSRSRREVDLCYAAAEVSTPDAPVARPVGTGDSAGRARIRTRRVRLFPSATGT